MKELRSEIIIDAPVERVWEILTRFDHYPRWNPFIREISGDLEEGGRLRVLIQPTGTKAMRFTPRVLRVEPLREIRWKGRILLPGIFDGEHMFRLEPTSEGGTRFTQSERFSGLLVPLFSKALDRDTARGFDEMNEALKQEAEAS